MASIYKCSELHPKNFTPQVLYRGRARIEQLVGKLESFKRVALGHKNRIELLPPSFLMLASILTKSVYGV